MRSTSKVVLNTVFAASCLAWMLIATGQAQDDRREGERGDESRGGGDRFRGGPPFGGFPGSGDRGGPSFGGFRGGDSGAGGPSFRGGPPGASGPGGSSDFYRRLDANGNGVLEPDEVPERMRGFMESRLGVNLSRPIPIRQLDEMRSRREGESRDGGGDDRNRGGSSSSTSTVTAVPANVEGGVPGFGAPSEELALVANFGNGSDLPTTPLEKRYDSRVLERVNEALARYDRNKDGVIDSTEWREWRSSSDPRTHDKNGDGRLNREELAARYASYSSGSSRSSGPSRSADSDRRRDDRSRGDEPSFGRSDNRGNGRPSFGSFSRGGDSSSGGTGDRMAMVANMMMSRLDKNGNGFVDGDEKNEMRDPKAADRDSDGKVSKDELAASFGSRSFGGPPGGGTPGGGPPGGGFFFGGRSGEGPSGGRFSGGPGGGPPGGGGFFGSRGEDRDRSRDGERGPRDGRTADSSRGASPAEEKPKSYRLLTAAERLAKQHDDLPDWFGRKDVNGDGQVSMAEFASVWSETAVNEFARADRNSDGTVTAAEAAAGPRTLTESNSYSGGNGTAVALADAGAGPSSAASADSGDKYARQATTMLVQLDGNKDRSVESAEWSAKSWTKSYGDFSAVDSNADGKLDQAELTNVLRSRGK